MNNFRLHIVGCGSARPTKLCSPSSQILTHKEKQFMIDCGEGTQIQLARQGVHLNRLNHIFISHLHGDHVLGLMGLISTFGMLGRTADLNIHAEPALEKLLSEHINFFCKDSTFSVRFSPFNPRQNELIFEDRTMSVRSIPLKHVVPSCGFLFEEKASLPHLKKDMIDFYKIPLCQLPAIKEGADYITPDGETVKNERLTTPAALPKRYAYCSDTAYYEKIVPIIENIDCLYHEATFMNSESARAKETKHSTAEQAATIAKLANVKQLILGHFSARYTDHREILSEAKAIFPNTFLASDGKNFEF